MKINHNHEQFITWVESDNSYSSLSANISWNRMKRIFFKMFKKEKWDPYIQSLSFDLDEEDKDYLYAKYKPLVEQWKCEKIDKEIVLREQELIEREKFLVELHKKRCHE